MRRSLFVYFKRGLIGLGILCLLYLLCTSAFMPIYTRHGQEVEVPDVTGLTFGAAQRILSAEGFRIIKAGEAYDSELPPGTVVFQNPLASAKVKRGRRIYVTVSKGERIVLMPRLVGKSERNATLELSRLGLVLGEVRYEYSSLYLKDVVAEQSIRENERIREGTEVDIVVSLGYVPDKFIVPNVVGKSLQDANKAIRKAGLEMGRITYQTTNELLPATVIEQSLKPDTETTMGQPIDLIVSKLPDKGEVE